MTRHLFRRCWGIGLIVWAVLTLFGASAAAAQDDPPPRPTLPPTATPTPLGTATPRPAPRQDDPTPEPRGRIIGTVIDLTTGAPAPDIAVLVGDVVIRTDANGNYERGGLPAGQYRVELQLTAAQGTAAQAPVTIELGADATVVQHLAFRSPAPAAQPTAATSPTPVVATATPAPPASSAPSAVPPLPTAASSPPRALPNTGAAQLPLGWLTIVACVLLALGVWQLRRVRADRSQ